MLEHEHCVAIAEKAVSLVDRIRRDADVAVGPSPRATIALHKGGRVQAYLEGRDYVIPDDIKRLVIPVFAHRIVVNSRYSTGLRRSDEAQAALQEILKTVSVPL